jgi:hypothetical protein
MMELHKTIAPNRKPFKYMRVGFFKSVIHYLFRFFIWYYSMFKFLSNNNNYNYRDCISIPSPIGYLFRSLREADFPKLLRYIGFGKSYLIPETTNFGIGEGIVYKKGFILKDLFSLIMIIEDMS